MSSWCFITECEDNITVGTGHISRSITFAKYIRELGHDVQFVINNNKFAEKIIKNNEFDYASKNILEPEFNTHYQVIFLDTYDKYLSNKYVELLKGHCEKLVIISDSFKDENIKADIVIYTSEYLKNIIYDVNTLVGAKYIIMNDSFIKKQKKFSKEINTMLIAFGGYDPHNVTLKIIESLATIQSELIDKKINILIGGLYPYKKILKDCFNTSDLLKDIKFVNDFLKLLSKISINKTIENKK